LLLQQKKKKFYFAKYNSSSPKSSQMQVTQCTCILSINEAMKIQVKIFTQAENFWASENLGGAAVAGLP